VAPLVPQADKTMVLRILDPVVHRFKNGNLAPCVSVAFGSALLSLKIILSRQDTAEHDLDVFSPFILRAT
jgi:hypothetical protein